MLFQSIVFTRANIKYLKIFFQILQVCAKVALNRQAIHSKVLIHLCGTHVISYDNTSFDKQVDTWQPWAGMDILIIH